MSPAPADRGHAGRPIADGDRRVTDGGRRVPDGGDGRRRGDGDGEPADYAAVLFDVDGTLVERTPDEVKRPAIRTGFEAAGIDPSEADVRAVAAGSPNARAVCRRHGRDPAAFYRAYGPATAARQVDLVRAGGKPAYDDVAAADLDCPTGLVSNNYRPVVAAVRERLPFAVGTARGVLPGPAGRRHRKPRPYHVLGALADLEIDPVRERALLVGDGAADVGAARRAGIDVAYLRRPADRPDGNDSDSDPESEADRDGDDPRESPAAAATYVVSSLHEAAAVAADGGLD